MTKFDAPGTAANTGRGRRGSPFLAKARLCRRDAERMCAVITVIAERASPSLGAEARRGLGRLDRLAGRTLGRRRGARVAMTVVETDEGLDLAAGLLECADALAGQGRPVEAFALEGIEGRLLEALLDAGRVAGGVPDDVSR